MDLKIDIGQELWNIIEKSYENESYSSAILDAMHLLTETIRNKTGLECDGANLIGKAFGGDNPMIQLNKLQTESESNIQKGIQEILRGFYTAVRNPRTHDKHNDFKEDADSIIYFINYLLNIIEKSKLSFEEPTYLKRVFDQHYVKTKEYSELLVKEIPKRQRAIIAISVILQRKNGDISSLSSFISALFNQLEDNDLFQVYKVISEELKCTSVDDEDIRTILHICPAKNWGKIDKIVKIRIENMLLENAKSGKYDLENRKCRFGSLSTWIETEHLLTFEDIQSWTFMVVRKIMEGDEEEKSYIERYFWDKICEVNRYEMNYFLKNYFETGMENHDEMIVKKLAIQIQYEENHPWWKVFEIALKDYPEIKYCDELPF